LRVRAQLLQSIRRLFRNWLQFVRGKGEGFVPIERVLEHRFHFRRVQLRAQFHIFLLGSGARKNWMRRVENQRQHQHHHHHQRANGSSRAEADENVASSPLLSFSIARRKISFRHVSAMILEEERELYTERSRGRAAQKEEEEGKDEERVATRASLESGSFFLFDAFLAGARCVYHLHFFMSRTKRVRKLFVSKNSQDQTSIFFVCCCCAFSQAGLPSHGSPKMVTHPSRKFSFALCGTILAFSAVMSAEEVFSGRTTVLPGAMTLGAKPKPSARAAGSEGDATKKKKSAASAHAKTVSFVSAAATATLTVLLAEEEEERILDDAPKVPPPPRRIFGAGVVARGVNREGEEKEEARQQPRRAVVVIVVIIVV